MDTLTVDTRKHAKLSKNFSEYAETYGVTDRAIRRWLHVGKKLADIPPLDAPEKMAEWWGRCMKHRTPDRLVAFASDKTTAVPPAPPPPADQPELPPRDFSNVQGLDIAENVFALRRTHAINKQLLDEALQGNNENLVTLRQRNFDRSFELLRKAELTLIEIQQKTGVLVPRDPVLSEISNVLEALVLMHQTMSVRVLAELQKSVGKRMPRILRILDSHLVPAIEKVRASEIHIFSKLETLDGPAALTPMLAAAAA